MNKSRIDILCEYLNNNTAKRYPIANGELANSTDYIKNGYLKMLAVIMQQSGSVSEGQLELFKRIVAGAEVDETAEDYLRMALDIEIEDYLNFSAECKDLKLKYRFILDAIIITCVQEKTKEQLALIAQFCESYVISKEELRYIATMAKAIISLNVSDYVTSYEIKEDSIPDAIFSDYMYLISNSCVCCNDHMTIFQPTHKEDVTVQVLDRVREIQTPCIKLIGAEICLNEYKLEFNDRERVVFEDCRFVGGDKYPIEFNHCGEIIIRNSSFNDFSTRTLDIYDSLLVSIDKCEFTNCKYRYSADWGDWEMLGGVIHSGNSSNVGKFDVTNTSFSDCGGVNRENYYRSAFISNIKAAVNNCHFANCWHMREGHGIDPENPKRTMFTQDSSTTNCTYENSASFC